LDRDPPIEIVLQQQAPIEPLTARVAEAVGQATRRDPG
jgi:hypothetical protein